MIGVDQPSVGQQDSIAHFLDVRISQQRCDRSAFEVTSHKTVTAGAVARNIRDSLSIWEETEAANCTICGGFIESVCVLSAWRHQPNFTLTELPLICSERN